MIALELFLNNLSYVAFETKLDLTSDWIVWIDAFLVWPTFLFEAVRLGDLNTFSAYFDYRVDFRPRLVSKGDSISEPWWGSTLIIDFFIFLSFELFTDLLSFKEVWWSKLETDLREIFENVAC